MRSYRTSSTDAGSLDLAYRPQAQAAGFKFERVVLDLDGSFFKESWDLLPYSANKVVLGTARDDAGETGYTYLIVFNNGDFAYPAPNLIVDGSALQGADLTGEQPFFGDAAVISLTHVTAYNAHVVTGGASDSVSSGSGSDWISTRGGDDYASIGSGVDTVFTGSGADYIESTDGAFDANDKIYAGSGRDEISFYGQDLADADFVQVRSVEVFGLSRGGGLELGAEAQRVGVEQLYVDDAVHAITVDAAFTRTLTVTMTGNWGNQVTIDASESSATVIVDAQYGLASLVRDFHGGTGSEDTLILSSGFGGLPAYGADLTVATGFEHIVVQSGTGDQGATVTLDTQADEIDAAFLDIDAHTLSGPDPLTFKAGQAGAAIHVLAGSGADRVTTGGGDDRIEGGLGGDTLAGRGGADVFVYSHVADSAFGEGAPGIDLLTDFRSGRDTIDVTGLGGDQASLKGQEISFFGNVGEGGDAAFAATAGDGVLDAVYHTDTHALWFDTDDSGTLDAGDLHLVLASASSLQGADLLAGQMVL